MAESRRGLRNGETLLIESRYWFVYKVNNYSKWQLSLIERQCIIIIIVIIIIINWSPLCTAGREWEHTISPKTPSHTTNPWKEEEEDKIVGDKQCD